MLTCMSPLWGPLCPYMHSTEAFLLSHKWMRKRGRLLMGSSTRGSWGGKYIQPMMNSPSTWIKNGFNKLWLATMMVTVGYQQVSSDKYTKCVFSLYLPQRSAGHHKGRCQAAIGPRCVCMGEALQHKSTTSHHANQLPQSSSPPHAILWTPCVVKKRDVKTHTIQGVWINEGWDIAPLRSEPIAQICVGEGDDM